MELDDGRPTVVVGKNREAPVGVDEGERMEFPEHLDGHLELAADALKDEVLHVALGEKDDLLVQRGHVHLRKNVAQIQGALSVHGRLCNEFADCLIRLCSVFVVHARVASRHPLAVVVVVVVQVASHIVQEIIVLAQFLFLFYYFEYVA